MKGDDSTKRPLTRPAALGTLPLMGEVCVSVHVNLPSKSEAPTEALSGELRTNSTQTPRPPWAGNRSSPHASAAKAVSTAHEAERAPVNPGVLRGWRAYGAQAPSGPTPPKRVLWLLSVAGQKVTRRRPPR